LRADVRELVHERVNVRVLDEVQAKRDVHEQYEVHVRVAEHTHCNEVKQNDEHEQTHEYVVERVRALELLVIIIRGEYRTNEHIVDLVEQSNSFKMS
jgi:hypothetical protein